MQIAVLCCCVRALQQAAELAALVAHHGSTPHDQRGVAQRLLEQLADALDAQRLAEAAARGRAMDLEEAAAAWLASLASLASS